MLLVYVLPMGCVGMPALPLLCWIGMVLHGCFVSGKSGHPCCVWAGMGLVLLCWVWSSLVDGVRPT